MAQAIFKEWFVENSKFKNQNAKLVNAEEIFVFEKGIEPGSRYYSQIPREKYIPFYRVRDLDKDYVDVYIPKEIAKDKICKPEDVLLSLDATVGRVKIGCNGAFSGGIRKIYSRDGFIKNSFIYFWLKTPYVQNTILEHASGTTILHAAPSIKCLKFYFDKTMIEKIQKLIDPIFEKILQLKVENQKLAALRDLLLPKLMSGKIRL
jgi:type I restriction enzyme S subunit